MGDIYKKKRSFVITKESIIVVVIFIYLEMPKSPANGSCFKKSAFTRLKVAKFEGS